MAIFREKHGWGGSFHCGTADWYYETDHLNGVLSTMRAIDGKSFALQSQKHLLGSSAFANPVT